MRLVALTLAASVAAGSAAGCGSDDHSSSDDLPHGGQVVKLDPREFSSDIDNRYWPMRPSTRWIYRETDGQGGEQRVVVIVERRTKRVANGVEARVVHDVVTERGRAAEITDDYYAQDVEGNVWYLGEATATYQHGRRVSTEGSFEAGVDGAQAGIVMPAHPRVGMRYRQERYEGHAEDRAKIVSLDERVRVPLRRFRHTLMTLETSPLEPDVLEAKFYARGVGVVLALDLSGGADRERLVRVTGGGRTTRG